MRKRRLFIGRIKKNCNYVAGSNTTIRAFGSIVSSVSCAHAWLLCRALFTQRVKVHTVTTMRSKIQSSHAWCPLHIDHLSARCVRMASNAAHATDGALNANEPNEKPQNANALCAFPHKMCCIVNKMACLSLLRRTLIRTGSGVPCNFNRKMSYFCMESGDRGVFGSFHRRYRTQFMRNGKY